MGVHVLCIPGGPLIGYIVRDTCHRGPDKKKAIGCERSPSVSLRCGKSFPTISGKKKLICALSAAWFEADRGVQSQSTWLCLHRMQGLAILEVRVLQTCGLSPAAGPSEPVFTWLSALFRGPSTSVPFQEQWGRKDADKPPGVPGYQA